MTAGYAALEPALVQRARDPLTYLRTSVIMSESGEQGLCEPSVFQRKVIDALRDHRWVYVVKPRQAWISTAGLAWLMAHVEYTAGRKGYLIAEKRETAESLWERGLYAYEQQPAQIQMPATRSGLRGLKFQHGGGVKVLTAGSDAPAIGQSIDVLHGSEFAFWTSQAQAISQILPGIAKRAHGRVLLETTPGQHESPAHRLWLASLAAEGRFHAVFLPWWGDPSYSRPPPPGWTPRAEDEGFLRKVNEAIRNHPEHLADYPLPTTGHLYFRAQALAGEFLGDVRLFESRYPTGPLDGWFTTQVPALPPAPLSAMLSTAIPDPAPFTTWEEYEPGCDYLIACDPNSYGSRGDPSAYTVWNRQDKREIAAWSGRMDPVELAYKLAALGKKYGNALIVIESNAAACITALQTANYPSVYMTSSSHPGWYRTANAKDRSHGHLARLLHAGEFKVRSKAGLLQLLSYDGSKSTAGRGHHWDRVDSYLIAADILCSMIVSSRTNAPERLTNGSIKVADLKRILRDKMPAPRL